MLAISQNAAATAQVRPPYLVQSTFQLSHFTTSTLQQLVRSSFCAFLSCTHSECSYYASKQCTYTDASGRPVPAPRPFKPEPQSSSSSSENRSFQSSNLMSSSSNQFRIYPNPPPGPSLQFQNEATDDDHKHVRKRFRNERGNPLPVDDLIIDGPVSMDRPAPIELDPSLTRELTNRMYPVSRPYSVS